MDYEGEWGVGGPGHSRALKWHERAWCIVMEILTGWGRFGGGGRFDPSLAVR
jgi:hypothetical protein